MSSFLHAKLYASCAFALSPAATASWKALTAVFNDELKEAFEKLKLNDASLTFEPENSQALGHGFRVGFLGLLHMDVIQERIEREFKIDIIATSPSVDYHVYLTNGTMLEIDNPSMLPDLTMIKRIKRFAREIIKHCKKIYVRRKHGE